MLNYKMNTYTIETTDGLYWVAEYPAIPGVVGSAKNVIDAVNDWIENAKIHLDVMKELGQTIPKEDALKEEIDYSGRITLRTSKMMHKKIIESAKAQGVSANQWMVESLTYAVGRYDVRNDELFPVIEEITQSISALAKRSEQVFTYAIKMYKVKNVKTDGFMRADKKYRVLKNEPFS